MRPPEIVSWSHQHPNQSILIFCSLIRATMVDMDSPRLDQLRKTLRPLTFAVFAGSQILDIINVTGVTFALPSISEKYGISETEASWVLSAYALTFGSFLLIAGRLGLYSLSHNSFLPPYIM